ncbi:hypothetical protein MNBD_GAMMA07-2175 [hydrothermal vent metagenome]|uniref:TauD/TfdA-like domain-containing protein n=1 Tax=hydrothermal vent metagenome TaxID=652676 RepID=A0A3B0XLE7_9ZZZZ
MPFDFFDIKSDLQYQKWRSQKLRTYDVGTHAQPVTINNADQLSLLEISNLLSRCNAYNFVIYALQDQAQSSKRFVYELGILLGLKHLNGNLCADEDNISSIQVRDNGRQSGYIPYSNKKLTWHTDGYYNKPSETIRAMILHCVQPAQSGGENWLLDHEVAYIQLRDQNPHYVKAFLQPDVLTIPANIENGKEIRAVQSGSVFSKHEASSTLHMRFSARTRNIEWKNNVVTQEAVACMNELLNTNNPYITTCRMKSGEGIIANNTLHNRTAFEDGQHKRLLYRARYYDRVKHQISP